MIMILKKLSIMIIKKVSMGTIIVVYHLGIHHHDTRSKPKENHKRHDNAEPTVN